MGLSFPTTSVRSTVDVLVSLGSSLGRTRAWLMAWPGGRKKRGFAHLTMTIESPLGSTCTTVGDISNSLGVCFVCPMTKTQASAMGDSKLTGTRRQ